MAWWQRKVDIIVGGVAVKVIELYVSGTTKIVWRAGNVCQVTYWDEVLVDSRDLSA